MSAKARYSQEQVAYMTAVYTAASTDAERKKAVSTISKANGRTTQSTISKLSRMNIYQSPEVIRKTDNSPNKEALIDHIRIMLNARDFELDSLVKASKRDLEVMSRCLNSMNDRFDAEQV